MLSRAIARSGRTLRSSTSRQCLRLSQQSGRRGYSSAKDTVKKAGSEVPWAISAIAVTIGGTYVALLPRSAPHDDHHDDHGEEHEEHEEKDEKEEEAPAEEQSEEPAKEGDKSEDKPEESGNEKAESSNNEEEKEQSESKDDSQKPEKGHTREKTGDSRGGEKVGEGASAGENDAMSSKQAGVSNTDTRHSTDQSKNPEKSNKGEGTLDTAKIKGTVDPSRPQK